MTTLSKAVRFQEPASDGNFSITGLGFAPKCYLLKTAGVPSVGTFADHQIVGFGGCDGTNQGSISTFASDLGTIAKRKQDSTAALTYCTNALGTTYARLVHVSLDADGVTLNAVNVDGSQRYHDLIAFGGDDIGTGDVVVRKITVPIGGLFTSEAIGFHANPAIFWSCGSDGDTLQDDCQGSIGFCADDAFSENRSISWEVVDGTGAVTKRTNAGVEPDEGLWLFFEGLPEGMGFDISAGNDSIGLASSFNSTNGIQWDFFFLGFGKGNDGSELGPLTAWRDLQTRTTAGIIGRTTTTSPSLPRPPYPDPKTFKPVGLLHLNTGGTSDASARVSIGFSSGDGASVTGQVATWGGRSDVGDDSHRIAKDAALITARENATQQEQANIDAFVADGFDEDWTQDGTGSPDATARDYIVLAVGSKATVVNPLAAQFGLRSLAPAVSITANPLSSRLGFTAFSPSLSIGANPLAAQLGFSGFSPSHGLTLSPGIGRTGFQTYSPVVPPSPAANPLVARLGMRAYAASLKSLTGPKCGPEWVLPERPVLWVPFYRDQQDLGPLQTVNDGIFKEEFTDPFV